MLILFLQIKIYNALNLEKSFSFLVKEGAIVCFCARGVEKGKQLETELNKIDRGKALFIQCDVTKEEHIMASILLDNIFCWTKVWLKNIMHIYNGIMNKI